MADDENLSDQDAERLANFVARATTASDRMTRETTRLQEGHARLRQQFGDEAVREWYSTLGRPSSAPHESAKYVMLFVALGSRSTASVTSKVRGLTASPSHQPSRP